MKTCAAPVWMLCCLGLLVPLHVAGADEPPQGFVKVTLGVEGDGLERIPVVGPLLKFFASGGEKCCAEQEVGRGDEQVQLQLPCPPEGRTASEAVKCPSCTGNERAVPILSKLPYVSRLFKNVGVATCNHACEMVEVDCAPRMAREFRILGADGLERIGIDFDCELVSNCEQGICTAACPAPSGEVSNEVAVLQAMLEMREGLMEARDSLIGELLEAKLAAAVAQTTLEVREAADTRQMELIKELVAAHVDNAKLTAKLELAAEKEKMLAELYEARVELTLLQTHVAKENDVAHRKRQRNEAEARRQVEAVR